MRRRVVFPLVLMVALGACNRAAEPAAPAQSAASAASPAPAATPAASTGKADWQGYGPLQLGTDVEQMRAAWDGELQGDAVADGGCYYLQPAGQGTEGVAFMIEGDTFVRYDVRSAGEPAPGGGEVGMDQEQLRALYVQAEAAQPHKYVQGGTVLAVPAADGSQGRLVFELGADGKVTGWRMGLPPQVDYVEGCS